MPISNSDSLLLAADSPEIRRPSVAPTRELGGLLLRLPDVPDRASVARALGELAAHCPSSGSRASSVCFFDDAISTPGDFAVWLNGMIDLAGESIGISTPLGWAIAPLSNGGCALAIVATNVRLGGTDLTDLADAFLLRCYGHTSAREDVPPSASPRPPSTDQVAFWRRELELPIAPIVLPGRRVRDPATAVSVSALMTTFSQQLGDRIRAFATQADCDIPAVLAAGFASVLSRYGAENEIGMQSSVLRRSDASASAGWFANSIVLRVDGSDDPDFRTALHRMRAAIEESVRNSDVSVERIGSAIDPRPESVPYTLPSIAFDLRSDPFPETDGPAIVLSHASDAGSPDSGWDLRVRCSTASGALRLRWQFNGAVYERETIERIAGQYMRLLDSVTLDPDRAISRVPLLSPAERAEQISAGRGADRAYERDSTVHALWSRQAQMTPDALALADEHTQLTYAQVERRANQLAHHLIAAGVGPGSTVGVAFDRSIEMPIALLGILKAGATYVPLDPTYPRERLELMIADAAIGFIIAREIGQEADGGQLVFAGRTIRLAAEAAAIDAQDSGPPDVAVTAHSIAYITYTSGSTGRPKGVCVPHRGIVRLVRGCDYVDITASDGYLQHAPLAFDASTFEIWAPLLNGAHLGIPRPGLLSMPDLAHAIQRFNVTTLFLTTALFGRLVESKLEAFGRLRHLLTGGEVASPAHMCRFLESYPKTRLSAVYGPTENTTFSTWMSLPTPEAIGVDVPIGRPIANSTAYVVDRHGEPAPIGIPGELWVGGDGVASGYLNLPERSQERFTEDPFAVAAAARVYKTGDRVRWRPDGVIEFLGRTDDQVKIRGFRIELGEIESVLQAHPGVSDAAVVAASHDGEKALYAFVVRNAFSTPSEAEFRAYLAAKLPRYMLPHAITIVSALPEHASGKIDRVSLARRATRAGSNVASPQPNSTPVRSQESRLRPVSTQRRIQETISSAWHDTLKLDAAPDLDMNFFDAGGDSLRLLRVHGILVERLGTDIQIMDLFEHTTIRSLAAFLNASSVTG